MAIISNIRRNVVAVDWQPKVRNALTWNDRSPISSDFDLPIAKSSYIQKNSQSEHDYHRNRRKYEINAICATGSWLSLRLCCACVLWFWASRIPGVVGFDATGRMYAGLSVAGNALEDVALTH